MKNKIKIIIMIIFISFSFSQNDNEEYFLWKKAEKFFQQKDYDEALKIYLKLFNESPNNYEYLKKIKHILIQSNSFDELIKKYEKFIANTLNEKLLFESETDLIEIKIWNDDQNWANDLYKIEQKYEKQKNNFYKFEFILMRILKNKKIDDAYDFILFLRKKYNKPTFFSRKLISIFKDASNYKQSINESLIFILNSEKNKKNSSITKKLIVDQIFESLDIIIKNSLVYDNYLPFTNKQLSSNIFFNLNQKKIYETKEIEYVIGIYNKLIQNKIREDDSLLNLSEIYQIIYADLDSAYTILTKLDQKANINTFKKVMIRKSDILISKGYVDSALKIITHGEKRINRFTLNNNNSNDIKIKNLEISMLKGDYHVFNKQLDSLINSMETNTEKYNELLELKLISLYFSEDIINFKKYSNILYKIKMNKGFESVVELVELINDENILISELAHFQYALIELQKGNLENTKKLIEQMKMKTIYSEISLIINAEIEDRVYKNYKKAIKYYEDILEKFPDTIYKENILNRLNEINKFVIEEYDL